MKNSKWEVDFGDELVVVYALSKVDAEILAMAKRIEDGKHHNVHCIMRIKERGEYE